MAAAFDSHRDGILVRFADVARDSAGARCHQPLRALIELAPAGTEERSPLESFSNHPSPPAPPRQKTANAIYFGFEMKKRSNGIEACAREVPSAAETLESDYAGLLEGFSRTHHEIASVLVRTQNSRAAMLRQYRSGARLRGLEQLLEYLTVAKNVFDRHTRLAKVSFLISRARDDFEVAIEATLSGAHGVVADQMRDVMEIEFLVRDFQHEPARIDD